MLQPYIESATTISDNILHTKIEEIVYIICYEMKKICKILYTLYYLLFKNSLKSIVCSTIRLVRQYLTKKEIKEKVKK